MPSPPPATSLLSAHDLKKSFGARQILDQVSLTIREHEKIGLVGNNGSGKSTLAKILAAIEPADEGEVQRQRGLSIGYLAQVPDLDDSLPAREYAERGLSRYYELKQRFEALSSQLALKPSDQTLVEEQGIVGAEIEQLGGWDQEHKIDRLFEGLHVPDPEAPLGRLSGGERRRVALVHLLLKAPQLLILDEPTNHLDTDVIDWLEAYLINEFQGALLLVTHDRYFLDRVVGRTLELHQGGLYSYDGGWGEFLLAKADREELAARTESNRQNFLRREIEWLRRQPKARGTKQKARTERAESAIDDAPVGAVQGPSIAVVSKRQGSDVLRLDQLGMEVAGRQLFENLNFEMTRGQRVGVLGPNGCGKTTLLRAITGDLPASSGQVKTGKNTSISYFDQRRSGLDDSQSVWESVAGTRDTVMLGEQSLNIHSYMSRFQFRSEDLRKKVGMLSGGERARVSLAKLLLKSTNLLVLDEPTNDLDVTLLGALEETLTAFAGSVIVVSHDRYFLNRVVTDLLVFESNDQVTHYTGNYDTYLSLRPSSAGALKAAKTAAPSATTNVQTAPKPSANARGAKLTYKETRELEELMPKIAGLEQTIQELQERLADPSLYRTAPGSATTLQVELSDAESELERTLARWEHLETKQANSK